MSSFSKYFFRKKVVVWKIIAGVICGFAAVILIVVWSLQSEMIYNPCPKLLCTPEQMGYDDCDVVDFKTSDGETLKGWFFKTSHEPSIGTALIFQPTSGNMSFAFDWYDLYLKNSFDVFVFDYRGFAESTGKPSKKGLNLDALAAYEYLVNNCNVETNKLIFTGRGVGGAVATKLATVHPPALLVLEGAFVNLPEVKSNLVPIAKYTIWSKFPTEDYIKNVHCPVLVVHSPYDRLVPYEYGAKLYRLANDPKEFLEVNGPHGDAPIASYTRYRDAITNLFKTTSNDLLKE